MPTLFERIVNRELPADIVHQDERVAYEGRVAPALVEDPHVTTRSA